MSAKCAAGPLYGEVRQGRDALGEDPARGVAGGYGHGQMLAMKPRRPAGAGRGPLFVRRRELMDAWAAYLSGAVRHPASLAYQLDSELYVYRLLNRLSTAIYSPQGNVPDTVTVPTGSQGEEQMTCIFDGCNEQGVNTIGVRLRRPDTNTTSIWAPNTNAMVCDRHANQGMRVTVHVELLDERVVETRVRAIGRVVERTTHIQHDP